MKCHCCGGEKQRLLRTEACPDCDQETWEEEPTLPRMLTLSEQARALAERMKVN